MIEKCECCGQRITVKTKNTPHVDGRGREVVGVYECPNCKAVIGTCYLGESYAIVKSAWFQGPDPERERWRYYDLITLGSRGIERRHGWFDIETRLVLQTG